ncbi:hypothetical protein BTVI_99235 [Pitangus sulphuratus]|nr:hypothetical protein BTVI_99235 [Pitangus sulphuratus]
MLQALSSVTWVCPAAASSTSRILSCQVAFHRDLQFQKKLLWQLFHGYYLVPLGQEPKTSGLSQDPDVKLLEFLVLQLEFLVSAATEDQSPPSLLLSYFKIFLWAKPTISKE